MDAATLTTRVAEVQDAIYARLEALRVARALEPGSVSLGWPPGGRHGKQVWVDEEATITPVYKVTTARKRNETIAVKVKCTVEITGNEYVLVRDDLLALVALVEEAVTPDPTLGGVAHMTRVAQIQIDAAFTDERTRFAGATVTLEVDVTVTPAA